MHTVTQHYVQTACGRQDVGVRKDKAEAGAGVQVRTASELGAPFELGFGAYMCWGRCWHSPVKLEFGWVREGPRGRTTSRSNPGTRLPTEGEAHGREMKYDSKWVECICRRRCMKIRPFSGSRVWHSIYLGGIGESKPHHFSLQLACTARKSPCLQSIAEL